MSRLANERLTTIPFTVTDGSERQGCKKSQSVLWNTEEEGKGEENEAENRFSGADAR